MKKEIECLKRLCYFNIFVYFGVDFICLLLVIELFEKGIEIDGELYEIYNVRELLDL